jgi:hypothetical protein
MWIGKGSGLIGIRVSLLTNASLYSSLPSLEGDGGLAYVEVNGLNAGRGSC